MGDDNTFIDIEDELILHIDGNETKLSTIPWERLKDIGDKLQALIFSIARSDAKLGANASNIDNSTFKLDFTGFYPGSAAPAFSYSKVGNQQLYASGEERKEVSRAFSELMKIADDGNYLRLKETIPIPINRNDLVENFYAFTSSFKGMPVSIAKKENDEIKDIYKIKRFKPEQKNKLITKFNNVVLEIAETHEAIAKVTITEKKGAKTKTKIADLYTSNDIDVAFMVDRIKLNNRIYILHNSFSFKMEKEDDFYLIESELLNIYACGETEKEAKENIISEFDVMYRRLNELDNDKLGKRMLRTKKQFELIIKEIQDK